jgi:hypothetical protein
MASVEMIDILWHWKWFSVAGASLGAVAICMVWWRARTEKFERPDREPEPPIEWLWERISVDEVERGEIHRLVWGHPPALLILGVDRNEWQLMKTLMTEDDELWEFSSPAEMWNMLTGRQGVALVRNGTIVAHMVTAMN